jgi:ribosome-binding factor A
MRRHRERGGGDGSRTLRLQELIREELNIALRSELNDPRLDGVVITMVELAADGSCARAWFSAEREEDARAALEHAAGLLRTEIAESLGLKRTPDLRFRRDPATRSLMPPSPEEDHAISDD